MRVTFVSFLLPYLKHKIHKVFITVSYRDAYRANVCTLMYVCGDQIVDGREVPSEQATKNCLGFTQMYHHTFWIF